MTLQPKKYKLVDCALMVIRCSPLFAAFEILFTVITSLIPSITVFTTASFVDTAISVFNGNAQRTAIIPPLLAIIILSVYNHLSGTLSSLIYMRLQRDLFEKIQTVFMEKQAKLKYRYIESSEAQDTIRRVFNDPAGKILNRYSGVLNVVSFAINVCSLLIILIRQVWWVGLATVVLAIPVFFISVKSGKKNYTAFTDAEKHERRAGFYDSVLAHKDFLEERALFGYTPKIMKDWREHIQIANKVSFSANKSASIKTNAAGLLSVFLAIFIIAMLIPSLGSNTTTIGMFIALANAALNITSMLTWQLSGIVQQFVYFKEYLADLSEFSQFEEQDGAIDLPRDMSDIKFESIEFNNVSFKYPDTERYILKNCSFKLMGGKHYAFVGVNGAGKTTITKLLTGLYDNYEGEILINGKNIKSYSYAQLKGFFTIVYQDFATYFIKFKDSIKLGNVLKDDDRRMYDALHAIELDDTVSRLPNGVNTYLGKITQNSVDLSGGEWQRLAIARSLYSDAPLSILDEPTAALDPVAESNIYQIFKQISAGKSALFITHRLGAARIADEIIVIDGGKVAEQGSHDKLLTQNGIYADMFNTQKGWYDV